MLKKTIAVICIAALLFTSCGKNNSKNSISNKNTPKTEQKNNEKNITSDNDSKTEETNSTSDKDSTTSETNNNSDNDSKTEETTDNSDNNSNTEETNNNSDNNSKTEETTDNSDNDSNTEETKNNSDNASNTEETTDNSDNASNTEETTDNSDNNSNTEETKNNSDNTSMAEETKGDEKPETPVSESLPQFSEMKDGEEYAIMKTTIGDIKIRFFPEYAPKTVENFVTHAKEDYYDGIIFHRVINDFMIQSGDPRGNGTGGKSIWGTYFEDEFTKELHNYRGALSMANAGPGTNGSQFFIVQAPIESEQIAAFMDNVIPQLEDIGDDYFPQGSIDKYKEIGGTPQLDFHHTVFGQIFEGMDVVDAIASVKTDENDKPKEDIVIKDIVIETYKAE